MQKHLQGAWRFCLGLAVLWPVTLALAQTKSGVADPPAPIVLDATRPIELTLNLTLPDAAAKDPAARAKVLSARHDHVAYGIEPFDVAGPLQTATRAGPTLEVHIAKPEALPLGVYELSVAILDKDDKPLTSPFVVALERVGVTLKDSGKLALSRTLGAWWCTDSISDWLCGNPQLEPSVPLILTTTTSKLKSLVGTLSATQLSFTASDKKAATGTLFPLGTTNDSATSKNGHEQPVPGTWSTMTVQPNQSIAFRLLPANFPLGATTGTLVVSGANLTDALTVNVEVDTRLAYIWAGGAIVLGLLLGWLTRVFLTTRLDWLRARDAAYALLASVQDDRAKIADTAYWTNIDPEVQTLENLCGRNLGDGGKRNALQNLFATSDAQSVTEVTKKLQQAVDKAHDDLTKLLQSANTTLATAQTVLDDLVPPLPDAFLDEAEALRNKVADARERLIRQDAGSALSGLTSALGVVGANLRTKTQEAFDAAESRRTELNEILPFFDINKSGRAPFATLNVQMDRASYTLPSGGDNAALAPLLCMWWQFGWLRRGDFAHLSDFLATDLVTLRRMVAMVVQDTAASDAQKTAANDAFATLDRVGVTLGSALTQGSAANGTPFPPDTLGADDFMSALAGMLDAVRALLPDDSARTKFDAARNSATGALVAGGAFAALGTVGAPHGSGGTGTALFPQPVFLASAQVVSSAVTQAAPAPVAVVSSPATPFSPTMVPRNYATLRARNFGSIAKDSLGQTLISSFIIGLVIAATKYDAFVGTWTDLLGMFTAGFTADLTVSGLAALLAKPAPLSTGK